MAETPAGVSIIEIRAGNSQRPVLELRPGEPVQPMSVGRVGMWPIDAPGVLDVHAYVYFDGRTLFLQSADVTNPAKGNGQAVGANWQQLEIPCTIEIGRARLVYRTLEEEDDADDKTVAQAIKLPPEAAQFRPGGGAFSNRQVDDEATRLQPMAREPDPTVVSPLEAAGGAPVPKARPAAGMPAAAPMLAQASPPWASHEPVPNSATAIGPAPAPPPPQTGYQAFGSVQVAVPAPPPAPNAGPQQRMGFMASGMGGMQPMQQTLQQPMQQPMPPGMGLQPGMGSQPGMGMPNMAPGNSGPMPMMGSGPFPQQMPGGPGPNADTSRLQPPGELTGFAKVKAEWNAMPPLRKLIIGTFPGVALLVYFMLFDDAPPPPPRPRHPVASASASVSATPPPTVATAPTGTAPTATATGTMTAPTATVIPTAVTSATIAPPPTSSPTHSKEPKGKKTPEREAIDLAAAGQYQKAAEIYDQLAAQHPEQPAYHEAARLLRERTNPP